MKKTLTLFFLIAIISLSYSQSLTSEKQKTASQKDTIKKDKATIEEQDENIDTLVTTSRKLKLFKKDAHASYYAEQFHGRKTASGKIFDMNKLTAAHKKLPFGTKLKVTNETNGKSVIVEITDRGPFVKAREIDLSKRAFMQIATHKGSGLMRVTLEFVNK